MRGGSHKKKKMEFIQMKLLLKISTALHHLLCFLRQQYAQQPSLSGEVCRLSLPVQLNVCKQIVMFHLLQFSFPFLKTCIFYFLLLTCLSLAFYVSVRKVSVSLFPIVFLVWNICEEIFGLFFTRKRLWKLCFPENKT